MFQVFDLQIYELILSRKCCPQNWLEKYIMCNQVLLAAQEDIWGKRQEAVVFQEV